MLNWWLGKPTEGSRVQDDSDQEPPETPAPVFAARALKSAIFGAPPIDEDTICEVEDKPEASPSKHRAKPQPRSSSPDRRSGILLTPGTATSKRKSVSFDNRLVDKEEERNAGVKGQGLSKNRSVDTGSEYSSSSWASSSSDGRSTRKTGLTKQLERVRDRKNRKRNSGESKSAFTVSAEGNDKTSEPRTDSGGEVKPEQSNQELMQQLIVRDYQDGDATMDLNQPLSQSGKFWKSEYEHYHEQAKLEMKRLLTYKEMAKSYAKLKDNQAINLAEKLKEEQRKVISMEDKITELSARIAIPHREGSDDNSTELIKELARQTALAVQYRSQVEEFRTALEAVGKETSPIRVQDDKRSASPGTEKTIIETQRELRKAREQVREMNSLREEVETLRKALSASDEKATKLEEENKRLTQELLHADFRLERQMEQSEKKRQSLEEQRQRKDEALQLLQTDYDDLKERAKAYRRDSEHLLKKRHDQIVDLKKELASFRGSECKVKELEQALTSRNREYGEVASVALNTITDLRERLANAYDSRGQPLSVPIKINKMLLPPPPKASSDDDRPQTRDSLIPVPSQSPSRPLKAAAKQTSSDTSSYSSGPRSSQSALSEIVNSASIDTVPPTRSGPVHHTPAGAPNRFSNQILDLELDLPSPEPSITYATNKLSQPSPRPSRFNFDITSSPPKPVMTRSYTTGELVGKRSSNELRRQLGSNMNIGSSRLENLDGSSSRIRKDVPPDRAAAARARLAERMKKRAGNAEREKGKENMIVRLPPP